MFTGIISELGKVKECVEGKQGKILKIACTDTLYDIKLGDSVSINGVCESVIAHTNKDFSVYASKHTLSLTNLKVLRINDFVNLERPLRPQDHMDGHIVQGHIDGTGVIEEFSHQSGYLLISASDNILKYMVEQGSVAVDGISLTINHLSARQFGLSIIPISLENTNLKFRRVKEVVNIEVDIFAKYISKFLENKGTDNKLTLKTLGENGFIN